MAVVKLLVFDTVVPHKEIRSAESYVGYVVALVEDYSVDQEPLDPGPVYEVVLRLDPHVHFITGLNHGLIFYLSHRLLLSHGFLIY